jgi:outer membrane autotransporter protein
MEPCGVRLDIRSLLASGAALILRGRAAWAHEFDRDRAITALFQVLPSAPFTVFGATPARDAALVSAAVEIRLANGLSAQAKFDGEFADGARAYAGSGTLRYTW